jgi:hypothetical protein
MPTAVQDALDHLNLLIDEGWEYPDAFDRAGTRLGTKGLKQLREAYDSQDYSKSMADEDMTPEQRRAFWQVAA